MVEQLSLVEVDEIAAEIKPPKIEKRTVKERRQQVLTVLKHQKQWKKVLMGIR